MDYQTLTSTLRSYYSLKKDLKRIEERIAQLEYDMQNVKGVQYDKIPSTPNNIQNELRMLMMIERKSILEKGKEQTQSLIARLKTILEAELEPYEPMVRNCLIRNAKGETLEQLADEYGYTKSGLWKKLKKEVEK